VPLDFLTLRLLLRGGPMVPSALTFLWSTLLALVAGAALSTGAFMFPILFVEESLRQCAKKRAMVAASTLAFGFPCPFSWPRVVPGSYPRRVPLDFLTLRLLLRGGPMVPSALTFLWSTLLALVAGAAQ